MKTLLSVRLLFAAAAAYELILGFAFIVAAPAVFAAAGIEPPNHWGYIHFSAGLLVIFGYMFLQIARDPVEHRELIPYGILLKVCYVATVGWHWAMGGVPDMWKYFAAIDFVFAVLFFWALVPVATAAEEPEPHATLPHPA